MISSDNDCIYPSFIWSRRQITMLTAMLIQARNVILHCNRLEMNDLLHGNAFPRNPYTQKTAFASDAKLVSKQQKFTINRYFKL